ncbi:MAG TPA: FAD-dependent monooxygenase [Acidobacteriaceae bacterium]|nr:FAD-dependent monooxygenase [Acidobacteriaceae bacterium]
MSTGPVLIVGAGPTGMTAAIELRRAGVPVRIIDKSDHMARWSQALVVQARTLEQFQRLGIAEEAVRRGRKIRGGRLFSEGKEIAHLDLSRLATTYPYALFLPQSETEALLNERMETLGVRTERRVELVGLQEDGEAVMARLRHPDGQEEEVHSPWLLGCDGAHSAVREKMHIPFEGTAIALRFILGDLVVEGPDAPWEELAVHFHHGDLVFLARLTDRITRVIVATHGEEEEPGDRTLRPDDFQRAVDRCGVRVKVLEGEWMTPFSVNDRQAKHYRAGRVFLAGDAAHIHSPVGGQGMNTGIQDAANLAWKLAAVGRGADPGLLDSYEEERGEVGRHLLRFTERVLRVGTSSNRLIEGVRDALIPLLTQLKSVQKEAAGFVSETAIHYRSSSVVHDHGGDGELRAGDRFPDFCELGSEGRGLLADWTDPVHLVFVANGSETQAQELQSGLRHARVRLLRSAALDNEGRRLLGAEEKLVIVRPDGYVGFRGPLRPHEDWGGYVQQDALV